MVGEGLLLADGDGGDRRDWREWDEQMRQGYRTRVTQPVGRAGVFWASSSAGPNTYGSLTTRPAEPGEFAAHPSPN